MNEFGENKWTKEQRAVDLMITSEFEAIEASVAAGEKPDATAVKSFRAHVSSLVDKDRQAHWGRELVRLVGAPPEPEKPAKAAKEEAPGKA